MIIICIPAFSINTDNVGARNGYLWDKMEDFEKTMYVLGYMDGMSDYPSNEDYLTDYYKLKEWSVKKIDVSLSYKAHTSMSKVIANHTIDEYISAIDDFYSNSGFKSYDFQSAFKYARKALAGDGKDKYLKELKGSDDTDSDGTDKETIY